MSGENQYWQSLFILAKNRPLFTVNPGMMNTLNGKERCLRHGRVQLLIRNVFLRFLK
jgi:hypothetical protein